MARPQPPSAHPTSIPPSGVARESSGPGGPLSYLLPVTSSTVKSVCTPRTGAVGFAARSPARATPGLGRLADQVGRVGWGQVGEGHLQEGGQLLHPHDARVVSPPAGRRLAEEPQVARVVVRHGRLVALLRHELHHDRARGRRRSLRAVEAQPHRRLRCGPRPGALRHQPGAVAEADALQQLRSEHVGYRPRPLRPEAPQQQPVPHRLLDHDARQAVAGARRRGGRRRRAAAQRLARRVEQQREPPQRQRVPTKRRRRRWEW